MIKIRCNKGHDGDWKRKVKSKTGRGLFQWILCGGRASEWWTIEGWKEIDVTLSLKPHSEAYKCKLTGHLPFFQIQAEDTEKWHAYELFTNLIMIIENMVPTKQSVKDKQYFYMGVRGVK